jgi:hypothetical protein
MMISVLHEPCVNFHLAFQNRFELRVHGFPRWNLGVTLRQLGGWWNHAQLFLFLKCDLPLLIPAVRKLPLVLVSPLLWNMMGGVCSAGREVDEERLIRHECLLLTNPRDSLVRKVLIQSIALFRGFWRFDGDGPVVESRIPLVGLPGYETVEVFEAASAGWPVVERAEGGCLPHWNLVTFTELRR